VDLQHRHHHDDVSHRHGGAVETVGTELRTNLLAPQNLLGLITGKSIFKTLYFSSRIATDLLQIIADKKVDIVHFESFYTAFYISDEIRNLRVKQVFGTENIEFKLYQEYVTNNVNPIIKSTFNQQVNRIKSEETLLMEKADMCFAVTAEEVKFIKQYNKNTFQIPNGVDMDEFKFDKPNKSKGANLLFVGNFSYFPNVEAITSFYDNVFNKLDPSVRMTVIGKKVGTLPFVNDLRIEAIEFVSDIKEAYRKADVLISPVKIGGGTNFKVLESMASGVPVIALKGRMEAVGAEDEKNVTIADNDLDFKNKIEKLLSDLELRQKLATNARKFVEEKYSWEKIGKDLAKAWNELV